MIQASGHLFLSVAALAVTVGFMGLTVNRLLKRKLRLSVLLLVGAIGISLVELLYRGLTADATAQLRVFQNLAIAAALINAVVLIAINPVRADRVLHRAPVPAPTCCAPCTVRG